MSSDDMEIRVRLSGARSAAGEMKGLKAEVVGTGAATDKAGRKSRQAGKAFGTLRSKVGALTSSYRGAVKGALAAGAAFASYEGLKSSVDTTVLLGKTTIGLTKNLGLSTKAASEWAAVAETRGVDTKALNMSFGKLSTNIDAATKGWKKQHAAIKALTATAPGQKKYQALLSAGWTKQQKTLHALSTKMGNHKKLQTLLAAGGGAQAQAFKALGVSQKALAKGDFNTILAQTADGLAKMGPGAERTALSMKLFGRGWQTIVPLLRDGSKGMKEQLALADKYGVTFKGKTVRSIQDLINAQREAKFATMGLQVAIGTTLVPVLTKALGAFSKFVLQVREGTGTGGRFRDKVEQIWKAAKPVVFWFGRAAKNVFAFVSKHPALVKVGVALFFVSRALRAMKFFSAISGAKRLLTWLGLIGKTKAGEAAASEITSSLAGGKGKPGIVGRLKASGIGAKLRGLGHSWGALIAPAMLLVLDNKVNDWLDKNVGPSPNKTFKNSPTTGKPSNALGPAGVPTLVSPGGGGGILDFLGIPKRSAGVSMTPAMGSPGGPSSGFSAFGDTHHHYYGPKEIKIGDSVIYRANEREARRKSNRK